MLDNQYDTGSTVNLWLIAYWVLFSSWVIGAALQMAGFHGGFFTSYLSDLACPPYLYIAFRGLQANPRKPLRATVLFSGTPELTAISIFLVGLLSEIAQLYKPFGLFAGTFDPLDIESYAIGLIMCYGFEKKYGHN